MGRTLERLIPRREQTAPGYTAQKRSRRTTPHLTSPYTFHEDVIAVYNIGAVQAADVLFVYSRQESTVCVLLCCKSCGVIKPYVSARLHAHGGAKPT